MRVSKIRKITKAFDRSIHPDMTTSTDCHTIVKAVSVTPNRFKKSKNELVTTNSQLYIIQSTIFQYIYVRLYSFKKKSHIYL